MKGSLHHQNHAMYLKPAQKVLEKS